MLEKLGLYDFFTCLVPGVLFLGGLYVLFPSAVNSVQKPPVPELVLSLGLMTLALFIGQIVQALSSFIEAALHRTWGGRPSDKVFEKGIGNRYLPPESAKRIRDKIRSKIGDASDRSVFLNAMAIAEADDKSRASRFNAAYGYHRSVVLLSLALLAAVVASGFVGALAAVTRIQYLVAISLSISITVLFWHRAKQRAFYYVREVLLVAERNLDNPPNSKSEGDTA